MKKHEVLNLNNALIACGKLKGKSENPIKFFYAVSKNLTSIEPEVKAINESLKPSEEYSAYEQKRIELCEKHANKDASGQPKTIMNGTSYDISGEDGNIKPEFTAEWEALKVENKEVIEGREAQIKMYEKSLEEECEVKLHKIKLENIPDDACGLVIAIDAIIEE